jgi:hypothetical protein
VRTFIVSNDFVGMRHVSGHKDISLYDKIRILVKLEDHVLIAKVLNEDKDIDTFLLGEGFQFVKRDLCSYMKSKNIL